MKSSLALIDLTLDGIGVIWGGIYQILRVIGRILWIIVSPVLALLAGALGLAFGGAQRAGRRGTSAMARRAARAEIESTVIEDPLRAQNRTLSGLVVILLAALVGAVLWATGQADEQNRQPLNTVLDSGSGLPLAAETPTNPPIAVVPTAIPTATQLPPALNARGSMAYVARENGQTDIFVIPVGGRTPIRITNDPADDRDPAWSPDGQRLAFASRRDGNWELYIYETSTAEVRRLTSDLAYQGAPSWSNDGLYLVYESYLGDDLGLYVLRTDSEQTPIPVPGEANSPSPDYAPSWSPDGRRIAFVSLREGNQDIYLYSLDGQAVVNLTQTPGRNEDHPVWSPDGQWIAYSALDAGQEKIFVISVETGVSQVINLGRAPAWSPDGSSIAAAVDSIDGTQIIVNPFTAAGAAAIIPAPLRTTSVTWTGQTLPTALVNGGGLPPAITEPLFVEEEDVYPGDPPYRLNAIAGVQVEQPLLSDRVNDSFNALREAANEQIGTDLLGRLDNAFWQLERPPQPGVERRNWYLTGRAFGLQRSGINGFPPPLEIVREDIGVETYWRVYVRVSEDAQSGQLGEPLRSLPWDFAARTSGDVEAYDAGGRLKPAVPTGYYVDFTEIAEDYGWIRAAAGRDWRANSEVINFWLFEKRDGLAWFDAMRELYGEGQLINFVPTATPVSGQASTLAAAPPLQIQPSAVPATRVPTTPPEAPPPAEGEGAA